MIVTKSISENDLGRILKAMYENAPSGEKMMSVHLFGILFAKNIKENNISLSDILLASGLKSTFITEINKGLNLAKYVNVDIEKIKRSYGGILKCIDFC